MKKEIGKGVILGIIIPLAFIALLYLIFYVFDGKINEQVLSSGMLFGLGINALLIRRLFKRDKDYLGRGIMISTFVFFMVWVIQFVL